jgi:hypothetical protein
MLVAAFLENKGIRNGITEVKKIYQEQLSNNIGFIASATQCWLFD